MMSFNFLFESLAAYLLVFVRMAAMLLFNPMLARRNVPSQFKMGFIICLTLLVAPTVEASHLAAYNAPDIVLAMVRELFVGFVCGFIFQLFYYLIFFTGDFLDIQFGLSMARVFDPGTNIQMSMTSNFLSLLFILYIFASDSHLILIRLFATSYMIIPVGAEKVTLDIAGFFMSLFISAFGVVFQLALPFVACELTIEMAMGVLMKLIPQITVFVINIQVKLFMALLLLLVFSGPISTFLGNYMNLMLQNIQNAMYALAGT